MAHLVTGKVRLSYEHIWEPASINDSDEKYSVSLIIPKSDTKTVKDIQNAVEQAKQDGKAKFGGRIPANLKLPLRDGDIERPDDEAYKDCYFINCNSKDKPQIVDKNVQPILDRNEVYSGCYARVSISLYPFNTNGNKGIACGLGNIQKIADGEPLGGRTRAEDDFEAYDEEEIAEGDTRVVLHLHPALAPYKVAVLPLSKKLSDKAEEVYNKLAKKFMCDYDAAGSIGKRYRREDEIGTPYCVTVDFDTLEDESVTVRDRDTMEQVRVKIDDLEAWIAEKIEF